MDHNCNWKWTSDAARFTDELVPDWLADYCSPPMLWVIIKSSWPVSCNWWMADVLLWAWRVAPSVSSPMNATGVECSQSYLDRCLLKMQPLLDSPLTKGIPHTQEAVLASCRYHLLFQLFYKGEMIESFPPTETFSPPPLFPHAAQQGSTRYWMIECPDWLIDWLIDWLGDWLMEWLIDTKFILSGQFYWDNHKHMPIDAELKRCGFLHHRRWMFAFDFNSIKYWWLLFDVSNFSGVFGFGPTWRSFVDVLNCIIVKSGPKMKIK